MDYEAEYMALGLSDEDDIELHSDTSYTGVRQWIDGYTRRGDFGGYDTIALAAPCGEFLDVFDAPEEIW